MWLPYVVVVADLSFKRAAELQLLAAKFASAQNASTPIPLNRKFDGKSKIATEHNCKGQARLVHYGERLSTKFDTEWNQRQHQVAHVADQ
ncbi:unnamed protein product [Phytophthora lilii]|uniref:Unnamed protein product n=1 Tax=Phytophthora lilii TaxID=2077276 RepID=A0A9W6YIL6_9STRA|nr:unnamed protein product [Phytophthora lilii]